MGFARMKLTPSLTAAVPAALMAALIAAALTGAGPAAAAAHRAGIARAGAAGTISTIAGGVGGPGQATKVALILGFSSRVCGVSSGSGHAYIGASTMVREVTPGTSQLSTPMGTGDAAPLGDGGPAQKA